MFNLLVYLRDFNESSDDEKVNALNKEGLSALHYAVRHGKLRCIKEILKSDGAGNTLIFFGQNENFGHFFLVLLDF